MCMWRACVCACVHHSLGHQHHAHHAQPTTGSEKPAPRASSSFLCPLGAALQAAVRASSSATNSSSAAAAPAGQQGRTPRAVLLLLQGPVPLARLRTGPWCCMAAAGPEDGRERPGWCMVRYGSVWWSGRGNGRGLGSGVPSTTRSGCGGHRADPQSRNDQAEREQDKGDPGDQQAGLQEQQ